MTTASTTTVVDHTGDTGFRAWVAEVIAQLLAVGLTQTADTGQINTTTVTRPGTNTSAGYAIFRFNDTAHSTSPVFFRIDFGTESTATTPRMLITVGTGSDGAGTINGTVLDQATLLSDIAPASTVTSYTSRFCYNTTQGFLGMVWKIAGGGTANVSLGGFFISRSTDSAGAVTTDAVSLLTNSGTTSGSTGFGAYMQVISYLTSTAYAAAIPPWPSQGWGYLPFTLTSSLYSGNLQVFPVFQYTPIVGVNANCAIGVLSEMPLGGTITSVALVGATTHTFLSVGSPFGNTQFTAQALPAATYSVMMLWE